MFSHERKRPFLVVIQQQPTEDYWTDLVSWNGEDEEREVYLLLPEASPRLRGSEAPALKRPQMSMSYNQKIYKIHIKYI